MTDAIIAWFTKTFSNPFLCTFLVSAVPVVELRGGIPLGVFLFLRAGASAKLAAAQAFLAAFLGSSLAAVLLVPLLIPVMGWLKRLPPFARLIARVEGKLKSKTSEFTKKRKGAFFWGLVWFVAVPCPGTGVWTGSAIAAFSGMRAKDGILAVLLGNALTGFLLAIISFAVGSLG